MFQLTMMGGVMMGFPDVCLTPTPVGPLPIPYPNISTGVTTIPTTTALNVLTDGMPSHNQMSEVFISNGDNTGVNLGVASASVMGPSEFILGSLTVLKEGMPAQRMCSMTGHNGLSMNCPGVCLAPSQVTVLVMG